MSDVKLIEHNASGVHNPDDLSYPFLLVVILSPPDFLVMAFLGTVHSNEILIVRGKIRQALEQFVETHDLATHTRLISLDITEENHD